MQNDGGAFVASGQVNGGNRADTLTVEDDVLRCYSVPEQRQERHVKTLKKLICIKLNVSTEWADMKISQGF